MRTRYFHQLSDASIRDRGGKKAENLRFLIKQRLNVPKGWVITDDAYSDYLKHGEKVLTRLRQEIEKTLPEDKYYAVRSSASVEDDHDYSYAGMFYSELQVRGPDNLLKAIINVWHSMESEAFQAYHRAHPDRAENVRLAVIIQDMVPALISGVVFSKNPLTGLSETILEAGQGTGEDQTVAQSNPERWVEKWGNWTQIPDSPIVDESLARSIVKHTKKIAERYGQPVDMEWAYDGKTLYFLQVRPITRMDIPVFSNRIAREMLPGMIKPLVWSVNTRLINRVWVDLLIQLTGDTSFQPDELTGHFFYRAYFNMSVFGRVFERLGMPYEALELLFGLESDGPDRPHLRPGSKILVRLPNLFGFLMSIGRIERQLATMLITQPKRYTQLITGMSADLSPTQWLDIVQEVANETTKVARMNILIPLLTMMQHRMLSSALKKHGIDSRSLVLEGVDVAQDRYSPHERLDQLRQRYPIIPPSDPATRQAYVNDLQVFLNDFGHFSDSGNDFSQIPWRENPELIERMLKEPAWKRTSTEKPIQFKDVKLPWPRRVFLQWLYRRTSRFAVHREAISSLYTFGYGQFRRCFLALGSSLHKQGYLGSAEDVFYLYWPELIESIQETNPVNLQSKVQQRKQEIASYQNAIMPDLIFGRETPPLPTETSKDLRGVPTSLGQYTGPACVVSGLEDFNKLNNGDVLIIPYSDVGWTPLFSKAGAVIAESGGMLSHSSIVAREYHIPAVVSVSGACLIPDGTMVLVNGYTGVIDRMDNPLPQNTMSNEIHSTSERTL
jgi:phosphohistidine swiveling domain-containing protein